jgi:Protein of unknown function (DUF3379)
MTMNLSEFIRHLGADPNSQDSEFLLARDAAPEFIQAASESARFERRLMRAVAVPVPADLLATLQKTTRAATGSPIGWRYYAMAASVLLVVAAAGIFWRMNATNFDSIDQYVAYHYHHDGADVLTLANGQRADNIEQVLSGFGVRLAPGLADTVSLIKFCPTPNGMGAHLVVNTASGPVTIIFMPDTLVTDGEMLAFDGMQAQLVGLVRGSAAVIGTTSQDVAKLHSLVKGSFIFPQGEA